MNKKMLNTLRAALIAIPSIFLLGTVLSHCSSGDGCDGSVLLVDAAECQAYAAEFNCAAFSFDNGICDVTDCGGCEDVVDDLDPVIDIDDGGF